MSSNKIINGMGRRSSRSVEWSEKIRKRDGKCKNCGTTENLHAHHILSWKDNISKRFDLENGITLCKSCHKKVDGCLPAGWNKGSSLPKEWRENISKSLKGRNVWNKGIKGIHVSPKTEFKKGIIPWNKGKSSIPEERICKTCGINKKIFMFTPQQKGKFYSHKCKDCRNKGK